MVEFPFVWMRNDLTGRSLVPRVDENGYRADVTDVEFWELSEAEVVPLIEYGFGTHDAEGALLRAYAAESGYQRKQWLYFYDVFESTEWDSELAKMMEDTFSSSEWETQLFPYGGDDLSALENFAKQYSDLVTFYQVYDDDGWGIFLLSVNDGVSLEDAREAFVTWEKNIMVG